MISFGGAMGPSAAARPVQPKKVRNTQFSGVQFAGGCCNPPSEKESSPQPAATPPSFPSGWKGKLRKLILGLTLATGGGTLGYQQYALSQMQHALEAQENQITSINKAVILPEVIQKALPANVQVSGPSGLGSGTFFKDAKGDLYIITNDHVVDDNAVNDAEVKAGTEKPRYDIRLYDGKDSPGVQVQAELVSTSSNVDLAVLKVVKKPFGLDTFQPPAFLNPSQFRDITKDPLKPGEPVFLVGTPRGLTDTVTSGIISHVERDNLAPDVISVQTDAPSNPGNSGGALYDNQGRLIGVLNSGFRMSDGLSFTIRIDSVIQWLEQQGISLKQ